MLWLYSILVKPWANWWFTVKGNETSVILYSFCTIVTFILFRIYFCIVRVNECCSKNITDSKYVEHVKVHSGWTLLCGKFCSERSFYFLSCLADILPRYSSWITIIIIHLFQWLIIAVGSTGLQKLK